MRRPWPSEVGAVVVDASGAEVARVVAVHARTWGREKGRVQSVTTTRRVVWRKNMTMPYVLVWTPRGWVHRWDKHTVVRIL